VNDSLTMNIDDLLVTLRRKGVPVQFEIGAFIVLEACEAIIRRPTVIGRSDVLIDDNGRVLVSASSGRATVEDSARSLIDILSELLLASAPGIPDMLLQIIEQGPSDRQWTLTRLRDDIEASLVPLNRSATRRVLARLVREANKEGDRRSTQPRFYKSQTELDHEFDELFGREPDDIAVSSAEPIDSTRPKKFDAYEDRAERRAFSSTPPERKASASSKPRDDEIVGDARRDSVRLSLETKQGLEDDFAGLEEKSDRPSRLLPSIGLLTIVLVIIIAYFVFIHRSENTSSVDLTSRTTTESQGHHKEEQNNRPEPPQVTGSILRVTSSPSNAQVLLFVGRSPVRVERLPLGVEHEFVAIADGFIPGRVVVPSDAVWKNENGVSMYTLEMTLDDQTARRPTSALGSTRLSQKASIPSKELGTVAVRTVPPNSTVYQLVGFTPSVAIENLATDKPIRLLVYTSGYEAKELDVRPDQWVEQNGRRTVEVDAVLVPK
jgi:hypothetical protein